MKAVTIPQPWAQHIILGHTQARYIYSDLEPPEGPFALHAEGFDTSLPLGALTGLARRANVAKYLPTGDEKHALEKILPQGVVAIMQCDRVQEITKDKATEIKEGDWPWITPRGTKRWHLRIICLISPPTKIERPPWGNDIWDLPDKLAACYQDFLDTDKRAMRRGRKEGHKQEILSLEGGGFVE